MKKLFKLIGLIEIMVSKVSELEMIHFLKYDDIFSSLIKGTIPTSSKLNQMNSGNSFF